MKFFYGTLGTNTFDFSLEFFILYFSKIFGLVLISVNNISERKDLWGNPDIVLYDKFFHDTMNLIIANKISSARAAAS